MSLKLYNALNNRIENFTPLKSGEVKMYACGITASGDAHIGHAYQAIVFDVIKKYLQFLGYNVTYVRNYTDVDDKIIVRAREFVISPTDYANKMIKKIDAELNHLGVEKPTIQSKATECIPDIIKFIQTLIENGHAYSTEYGDVFFKVDSFSEYGKLSNRIVEDGLTGVRKSVEPGKLDDKDFALWKKAGDDEIYWESPWGRGRPGWHIECSVMAMKYLGETIDIHGGGRDLIFPHHENEIAQTESLTGKPFANYWVHNGLIKINGQKMSKSLNNGILLCDLLQKYNPEVIKMALISNKYNSDMNVVTGMFESVENNIYDFYKTFIAVEELSNGYQANENSADYKEVKDSLIKAMDNDFNSAVAIANLFYYIKKLKSYIKQSNIQGAVDLKFALQQIYGKVFGLLQQNPKEVVAEIQNKYLKLYSISGEEINLLIQKRNELKSQGDYAGADMIRNTLLDKHIIIKDSKNGTEWDVSICSDLKK